MKHKTRKSLTRRVKLTKTGKLIMRSRNLRHLRRNKSKDQIRRLKRPKVLKGGLRKNLLRILGVA